MPHLNIPLSGAGLRLIRGLVRRGLTCLNVTLAILLLLPATKGAADTLTVAVASNFAKPMTELAKAFEQHTGHSVRLAFGSSGKLTAQILQGAPFQLFFSADQTKPAALIERGAAVPGSQFTYAQGGLALWSKNESAKPYDMLRNGHYTKLALANPRLAPYGAAAQEVLSQLNVLEESRSKWVLGENIAQTYQFVDSGNAELGFVALSQITAQEQTRNGASWIVPINLHSPIRQDAVLIGTQPGAAAQNFMTFIRSTAATEIIKSYGYRVAESESGAVQ